MSLRMSVLTPCPPLPSGEGGRSVGSAAGSRFVITDHALDRFSERYNGLDVLQPDQCKQRLLAELERAVPFGGQLGKDKLYLLPCGLVAPVVWGDRRGFVKTVLTREQAIANMESQGAILRLARAVPNQFRDADSAEGKAELRALAEQHVDARLGRKERNAILRDRGFDPAGRAGEIYRAACRRVVEEKWAANREAYLRRRVS